MLAKYAPLGIILSILSTPIVAMEKSCTPDIIDVTQQNNTELSITINQKLTTSYKCRLLVSLHDFHKDDLAIAVDDAQQQLMRTNHPKFKFSYVSGPSHQQLQDELYTIALKEQTMLKELPSEEKTIPSDIIARALNIKNAQIYRLLLMYVK